MRTDIRQTRQTLLAAMGFAPVAGLALTGCDADPAAHAALAAGPPLNLTVDPIQTGTTVYATVAGATPGETVVLVAGTTAGSGPCPAPLGGLCLDVADASVAARGVADGSGLAQLDVLVPSTIPDGTPIALQAAHGGASPNLSQLVFDVADHPTRVCGEHPEPDPTNYWDYWEYMICSPNAPATCPPVAQVDDRTLLNAWYRLTDQARGGGLFWTVNPTCHETTIEDRCCYVTEVSAAAIGRPFFVDGKPRTAEPACTDTWAQRVAVDPSRLPRRVRRRLARQWTNTAHGEHASVASFARFQLHLMQLGAPADLVADATMAMADEVRHAQQAFGVASALAGEPVGPGPLDTTDAVGTPTLREAVEAAVREGCIAETIAASQVREAARRCEVPVLASILQQTADDETRHAALAWRFVRWALQTHPELTEHVAAVFAEALPDLPHAVDPDAEELEAWGQLSKRTAGQVARTVLDEVIAPCAAALLADAPEVVAA